MSFWRQPKVTTLGLFDKRIEGDDCLMDLARRRFREARMGAEMHAATPEQLQWAMSFRPSEDTPVMVHLPRDFDLADERSRRRILELAARFGREISGLVLHDHSAMPARKKDYIEASWALDSSLERSGGAPMLFVEYAVGLEPADFVRFFETIPDLERISPCVDVGHIGVRQARAIFARSHRGEDICGLKAKPARLPQVIAEVEAAVTSAAAKVLDLITAVSKLKKPVHFHLHDAHPLSTFSPYGVSDHLGFLTEIPLGFEYRGRRAVPPMFGPAGLAKLVAHALDTIGPRPVSFTLEIHPARGQLPLGDAASMFHHWTDKTNAERMNHWLDLLTRNHELLQQAVKAASPPAAAAVAAGSEPGACDDQL